ncbi:DinB family protein [Robertkochia sediminum]|uniref:DinB family protein n=1 Tax=Robertkochia sediminum TaxID=2785326 RepID=UPI001934A6A2|nr:DinB family protein [Robertkochia sediminum]MBL7473579.1 DinB family protein [Robertkochia sediminum]
MKTRDLTEAEYGAFYAGYISVLGEAELLEEMEVRTKHFLMLLEALDDDRLAYRYDPGKWSIGELILHIIDAERVFQYRALRLGRGDETPLPGYDQDLFVRTCNAGERSLASLRDEFVAVREASRSLFRSFSEKELVRMGEASDSKVSVRALGFMICGHQKHHENILKERYLA